MFPRRPLDALVKACDCLLRFARSARRDGRLQLSAKLAKDVGSLCASMARVEAQIRESPSRPRVQGDEVAAVPSRSKRDRRPDVVVVSAPLKRQEKRAAVAMVELHDAEEEPDGHAQNDKEEPDRRAKNKAKRVTEGCVARCIAPDDGIVFVTSVEDDDALVACKDAARKRGYCCRPVWLRILLTNCCCYSQEGRS